jgi:23S rRNA (cytosine1962-C5)-methyltransferase
MQTLTIKAERGWPTRAGHPWLFRDDVLNLPRTIEDGAECEVLDAHGAFVGRGLLAARSQIICRIYSRQREPLNEHFFRRRIEAARDLRTELGFPNDQTDSYRAVFAEADRLPGLTVDRYGDYLVIQTPTPGLDQRKAMIVETLAEIYQPRGICERNDMPVRKSDCLPLVSGWLMGDSPASIRIRENGLRYDVDPIGAMKTGHFFDQRDNRLLLAPLCRDKNVLEVFSYTGGFGLTAAQHGAARVLAVDSSAEAIAAAESNARLNGLADRIEHRVGDALETLKQLEHEHRKYDVIVLDPPAFAKNKTHVDHALRGYRKLNRQAFKLLNVGGHLLSCSCSYHVHRRLFRDAMMQAAGEARCVARIVAEGVAGKDHPVLLNVPETEYLKSLLVTAVEKF